MNDNPQENKKETRFQKLLSDFDDDDKSKLRLYKVKMDNDYTDDDPMWKLIRSLEYYQRMYEAMPQAIKEACDSQRQSVESISKAATAVAQTDIGLATARSVARIAKSEAEVSKAIGVAAEGAAGDIAKDVIGKMDDMLGHQRKIDGMIMESTDSVLKWATVILAILVADLITYVRTLSNDLPAKYDTFAHFFEYAFNIPAGYVLLILCARVGWSLSLKAWDVWESKKIAKINANGGMNSLQ